MNPRNSRPPRTGLRLILLILIGIFAAGVAAGYHYIGRAPGELLRYTEKRLIGHPKLETVSKPLAAWLRPRIERPVTQLPTPQNQGQQGSALPPQRFDDKGRPLALSMPISPAAFDTLSVVRTIGPEDDLAARLHAARAGETIELRAGRYRMARSIRLNNGGTPFLPITVRAAHPGSVVIEATASEGFVIQAPYWTFENLVLRGICPNHNNCEHAFHVVGKAHGTVIRNNRIEDYNAHIKVNGLNGHWPDQGLIQFNTLTNSAPRRTAHSVTLIDIVAANHWQVVDNVVTDFIKSDGNRVSYGVFIKGGGEHGLIARNLIICTSQDVSQSGVRIGASFGGGGTDPRTCRDKRCITEHTHGTMADNVIAHCNDFGIYINRSNQTHIQRNTLINTYGIDVRYPTSSATLVDNQLDGIIRTRDGAELIAPHAN